MSVLSRVRTWFARPTKTEDTNDTPATTEPDATSDTAKTAADD